jgi:flagellar basal-body rod protein FlgB
MNLFGEIGATTRGLGFHRDRHELLASNIVNANTPGYRPVDLRFKEALDGAVGMQATDSRHFGLSGGHTREREVYDDSSVAPSLDGNAVSLERQMSKLMANSIRFNATATLLNRRLAMIRYAAKDGS